MTGDFRPDAAGVSDKGRTDEYACPGIAAPQPADAPPEGYVACWRAGHQCPPKVPLTSEADGFRTTTYRCPCCGDYGVMWGEPISPENADGDTHG